MLKKISSLLFFVFCLGLIQYSAFAKEVYCKIEYYYNGTNNMRVSLISENNKKYYIKGFVREKDNQIRVFYSDKKLSKSETNTIIIPQSMFLLPVRVILSDEKGSLPFSDINSSPYKDYIWHLASIGKIDGYKDKTFKPKNPVTRQEFAKFIISVFDIPKKTFSKYSFLDINNSWAKDEIETLFKLGYINGIKDKNGKMYFKPNDKITYEQATAIVCRVLKLKTSGQLQNYNSWANEYINAMVDNNILTEKDIKSIKLSLYATREWVSYILSKALVR